MSNVNAWASGAVQSAVNAIRQAGARTQYILLPGESHHRDCQKKCSSATGNGWTGASTFVSSGSAAALNTVTDPIGGTSKLSMSNTYPTPIMPQSYTKTLTNPHHSLRHPPILRQRRLRHPHPMRDQPHLRRLPTPRHLAAAEQAHSPPVRNRRRVERFHVPVVRLPGV